MQDRQWETIPYICLELPKPSEHKNHFVRKVITMT